MNSNVIIYLLSLISFILSKCTVFKLENWNVFFIVHVHSRFIETFGTHIVVGVKMGGKDVIYMKQQHSSTLQPADIQKKLKDMADKRFLDANGQYGMPSEQVYKNDKVLNASMVLNLVQHFHFSI